MNGCYRHGIDGKGRLFVPAKLREELGASFYTTIYLDNSLAMYSMDAWQELKKKIEAQPIAKARQMRLMLFPSAVLCEPDAQGRVVLPKKLRDFACLDKEAVIVGVSDHAEIWNAEKWDEFERSSMSSELLASAMNELEL